MDNIGNVTAPLLRQLQSSAPPPASAPPLISFVAIVFAFFAWTLLVVLFFPRILGFTVAFLYNRTSGGSNYVSIPAFHIYPLAGRLVAHSVRFTNVNFTATVEEAVLQFRWWRRHETLNTTKEQILSAESPEDFNKVALAQQKTDKENSAKFLKRLYFKVIRWWSRSAVAKDPKNSLERATLISVILVGLHVRYVNNARNHTHVKEILNIFSRPQSSAPSTSCQSGTNLNRNNDTTDNIPPTGRQTNANSSPNGNTDDNSTATSSTQNINNHNHNHNNNNGNAVTGNNTDNVNASTSINIPNLKNTIQSPNLSSSTHSATSQSSVASVDEKPFLDSVLELSSLRINDAAVYFCDMGQSPLLRLTFDTAKLRYRYGAADCPADLCRKVIVAGVSSLKLSVASQNSVGSILKASNLNLSSGDDTFSREQKKQMKDNTEALIAKVISLGYKGLDESLLNVESNFTTASRLDRFTQSRKSMRNTIIERLPSFSSKAQARQERRDLRKSFNLSCVDLFHSTTAVIEYVFDEPGLELDAQPARQYRNDRRDDPNRFVIDIPSPSSSSQSQQLPHQIQLHDHTEDSNLPLPPPVCRVSVLCKGAEAIYDAGAQSDVDRVLERFSPYLYDYLADSAECQAKEGKRLATSLQIQVNATPKTVEGSKPEDENFKSILKVPFKPQRSSWITLLVSKIREKTQGKRTADDKVPESIEDDMISEVNIPDSYLDLQCSKLSVLTEIPYVNGSQQKLIISMKKPKVQSKGIANMPLVKSDNATITRTTNHPKIWNEEVLTDTEIQFSNSEILYVPDFMKVFGDVSTTMQQQSRKAPAVNYFVPSKETITVIAKDKYSVNLSCGRDNAWKDVMKGIGDEFGKLKLVGRDGELRLMPTNATQYNSDSYAMSWSLSLPDVRAYLELMLPSVQMQNTTDSDNVTNNVTTKGMDQQRTINRVRAPSLSRRAKSTVEDVSQANTRSRALKEEKYSTTDIEIMRFDGSFELKGKSLSHEDRRSFLQSVPTFLDAVNLSEMSFHANSLCYDLNPFHLNHIMNIIKNYISGGAHVISTLERTRLDKLRDQIATSVCSSLRYPDWGECLILGLAPGFTLPESHLSRPGLDDLFQMTISIDSILLRLHELPHACCPFDYSSQNVSSIVMNQFYGDLKSNRLGSEMTILPSSNSQICLYGGFLSTPNVLPDVQTGLKTGRITPTLKIDQLKIHKHSLATEDWSSYFSSLDLSINKVSGCLIDMTVASISRISSNLVPDSASESIITAGSLLSIDNIEVFCKKLDFFILSPSSRTASANVSSTNINQNIHNSRSASIRQYRKIGNLPIPKYLVGVSQLRLRNGFRFVSSSLAFDEDGAISRLLLPSLSFDTLVPTGGKLLPWVDEVTIRAQVSHATIPRRNSSQEMAMEYSIMSRALEVQGITIEVTSTSRTSFWNSSLPSLQNQHVRRQHMMYRRDLPRWCSRRKFSRNSQPGDPLTNGLELELDWMDFVQNANLARLVYVHRTQIERRTDIISVRLPTETVVFIAPEVIHLGMEIVTRAKELSTRYDLFVRKVPSTPSVRFNPSSVSRDSVKLNPDILSSDLISLWNEFEKYKEPTWISKQDKITSGSSFKAIETKGVKILLLSPTIVSSSALTRDSLMVQRFSEDHVYASIPSGLHVIKELRFDVTQSQAHMTETPNLQQPHRFTKLVRTDLLYGHVESITVGSNDVPLMKTGKIILVNRERNSMTAAQSSSNDENQCSKRDRKTSIANFETLHIGQPPADLNTYAAFGRVLSIYLLLVRSVSNEMQSLSDNAQIRYATLCDTVLSCPRDEVMVVDPNLARSFFVSALRSSAENRNDTTLVEGVSLNSMSIPNLSDMRKRTEVPTQNVVHSIDISVKNMSFTLDDQEVINFDVLSCKGGKTSAAEKTTVSDLEGYVLNASFGTLSFSMRDDVATRTLRMVGRVASYLQKASLSLPILHSASPEGVASSNLSGMFRASETLNSRVYFNESSIKSSSQRSRNGRRLHTYNRHLSQFSRGPYSAPKARSVSFLSPVQSVPTSLSPNIGSNENETVPGDVLGAKSFTSPLPNPFLSDNNRIESVKGNRSPQSPQYVYSSKRAGITRRRSLTNAPSPGESNIQDDNEEEVEEGFKSVSVRTAGEYGPPRKRSRCLVPVAPLVPPAFTEIRERINSNMNDSSNNVKTFESSSKSNRASKGPSRISTFGNRSNDTAFTTLQSGFTNNRLESSQSTSKPIKPNVTLFVSCREFVSRYYRGADVRSPAKSKKDNSGNITFIVHAPRLTFMSHPESHRYSLVFTASSSKLFSSNNPHCVLTGSIAQIGGKVSLSNSHNLSSPPKLLISCRVTEFKVSLLAKDLKSVQMFRNEFQTDLKSVLATFFTTKRSVKNMIKTTHLDSTKDTSGQSTTFSTMAFDVICERSDVKLEGFHPNDTNMSISYVLDGIFFSIAASEDDNAALALGLRVYGHGLLLSSPSWPGNEYFQLPSLDARGVQWSEAMSLPTILKVTTEPLVSLTSFQGLRHVLFTVSGLLAFQNKSATEDQQQDILEPSSLGVQIPALNLDSTENQAQNLESSQPASTAGASPFTRSLAAWERTKGVRMDISIRPIALSLASGQVVALFDLETLTGSVEWNKLVKSGVQLRMSVIVEKVSLCFLRMPNVDFTAHDVRNDDKRSSLSIVLEKSRIDLLKKQQDLTHTFIFRTNMAAVSGQVRPWRLLLDASVWADEQEFVSDLQSINYSALSASRQRPPRSQSLHDAIKAPTEHRLLLFGGNIQRVRLAVPIVNSEQYATSRLCVRATDLQFFARHRFDSLTKPTRNIFEMKSHFIGIVWEDSLLLSSHHSRITLGTKKSSPSSSSFLGSLSIVLVPGTWRICPRKDVVVAILEAKNRKDNKVSSVSQMLVTTGGFSDSNLGSANQVDSLSNITEKDSRLLVERLNLKVLRTRGFIEGLENDTSPDAANSMNYQRGRKDSVAKVSVPAFSISVIRRPDHDFDLIDIDFSQGEGEFPRGCLQRVANIFSDLFGVVASDQEQTQQNHLNGPSSSSTLQMHRSNSHQQQQQQQQREISRDLSMLIRFGGSLYKAQEEANLSFESKIALSATKYSALLVSVTNKPILSDECFPATVISGVAQNLILEISPLLEGAEMQTLGLGDVRFLHGLCPSHAPHTLFHINRIKAYMEAKTLLLVQNRLKNNGIEDDEDTTEEGKLASLPVPEISNTSSQTPEGTSGQERKLMLVFGKARTKQKSADASTSSVLRGNNPNNTGKKINEIRRASEADILMQLKLSTKSSSDSNDDNRAKLIIERLFIGVTSELENDEVNSENPSTRKQQFAIPEPLKRVVQTIHCATNDMIVRGNWDILTCQLRLRENLFYFNRSQLLDPGTYGISNNGLQCSIANIINRLNVENLQFGKRTLKLDVDALAVKWMVPSREIEIESTKVETELSHTLFKAINKLTSQWKRLRNEVKLLTERDATKRKDKGIVNMKAKQKNSKLDKNATTDPQQSGGPQDRPFVKETRDPLLTTQLSDVGANTGDRSPVVTKTFGVVSPDDAALVESLARPSGTAGSSIIPTDSLARSLTTLSSVDIFNRTPNESSPEILKTKVSIRGAKIVIMMRGYQFDESRHSAMITLYQYEVGHIHDVEKIQQGTSLSEKTTDAREIRVLRTDFKELRISFNDDESGKPSILFKVPTPHLKLSIRDSESMPTVIVPGKVVGIDVELSGDLEIQLGHAFYKFQEFKELIDLTIHGIAPAAPKDTDTATSSKDSGVKNRAGSREKTERSVDGKLIRQSRMNLNIGGSANSVPTGDASDANQQGAGGGSNSQQSGNQSGSEQVTELWDGKRLASIQVDVDPRVDAFGDLTADLLPQVDRLFTEDVEFVPKLMFDYMVLPLEQLSNAVCSPLQR